MMRINYCGYWRIRTIIRPISSAMVSGNISGITASLTTSGTQSVSTMMVNSVLDLGDMRTYLTPKVTIAPGGMIDSQAFEVHLQNLHMMHRLI